MASWMAEREGEAGTEGCSAGRRVFAWLMDFGGGSLRLVAVVREVGGGEWASGGNMRWLSGLEAQVVGRALRSSSGTTGSLGASPSSNRFRDSRSLSTFACATSCLLAFLLPFHK